MHAIDDDTQGLGAKNRADQARCCEQVRSCERTLELMLFIPLRLFAKCLGL
jgi:hypothetical protein